MKVWRVLCEDKNVTRSGTSGRLVAKLRKEGRLVAFLFRYERYDRGVVIHAYCSVDLSA